MLKSQDTGVIYRHGFDYATTGNPEALEAVRQLHELANDDEKFSVIFWWEEGTRNHTRNQKHQNECMDALKRLI